MEKCNRCVMPPLFDKKCRTSLIPSSYDRAPLKMRAVISPTLNPAVATQFLTESAFCEYNASTAHKEVTF